MRARFLLVAFLAAFALPVAPVWAVDQAVRLGCNFYSPKTVTISEGDSITWTNTCGYHDVVFDDGSFRAPPQPDFPPWTATRIFTTPGTFRYYCSEHGSPGGIGMAGSVIVNAREPTPGGSPSPSPTPPPPGAQVPTGLPPSASPPAVAPRSKRKCASRRRFVIRIRDPGGIRIKSAKVSVNGKPVRVSQRRVAGRMRHTANVDLRGLPRGTYEAKIVVTTAGGKVLHGTRRYRTCARKRIPVKLPRL